MWIGLSVFLVQGGRCTYDVDATGGVFFAHFYCT